MTDWRDIDISLIMKKVCDFDLKVSEEMGVGVGMEQRKFLDQYLTSDKVSTRSIQRFKRCPLLKTLTKNFSIKVCDLDLIVSEGVGLVKH